MSRGQKKSTRVFTGEKWKQLPQREALRVRGVREGLPVVLAAEPASENPHWRKAIQVHRVWKGLSSELKTYSASKDSYRREALQV